MLDYVSIITGLVPEVLKKIIELSNELPSKLERAVKDWDREQGLELEHTSRGLLRNIHIDLEENKSPAQEELKGMLRDGSIPDADLWLKALMERWKQVRESLPESDCHPFYLQDSHIAEQKLRSLAQKLNSTCAEDQKLFQKHTYKATSGLEKFNVDFAEFKNIALNLQKGKIAQLTSTLSKEKEARLEEYRELYREGRHDEACSKVLALRNDVNWEDLENTLKAKICKILASYSLNLKQDLNITQKYISEALAYDPEIDLTVINLFLEYHTNGAKSALSQIDCSINVDVFNFKLGLLFELGENNEVITLVRTKPAEISLNSESLRLHALALLLLGDPISAQVEINKAIHQNPKWESVLIAEAIIAFYSAVSPSIIPNHLMSWPTPIEWAYIKRDDKSIALLERAEDIFKYLVEIKSKDKDDFEIWQLACLANNLKKQKEASDFCGELLSTDPGNPRALAWAFARNYKVNFSQSYNNLKGVSKNKQDYIQRIIALINLYLQEEKLFDASDLLREKEEDFKERGLYDLWLIWKSNLLIVENEPEQILKIADLIEDKDSKVYIKTNAQKEIARKTKGYDSYIKHLENNYKETKEGHFLYECCSLKASLNNWDYVANRAIELINVIMTPAALELALNGLWLAKSKNAELCLELLEKHSNMFETNILPSHLRRLKINCQNYLGYIPESLVEAEDIFRNDDSTDNLIVLLNTQVNSGDRIGLLYGARLLLERNDVEIINILRVARAVMHENSKLASDLWRKALIIGLEKKQYLADLLELGYRLGLDKELAPIIELIPKNASKGLGNLKAINLKEWISLHKRDREALDEFTRLYNNGEMPIHFFAERFNISLIKIYHDLPAQNKNAQSLHFGLPIFIRHGGKLLFKDLPIDANSKLHLDVSAILLAEHIGILNEVETFFKELRISSALPLLLQHQIDILAHHQPSQITAFEEIISLHKKQLLNTYSISPEKAKVHSEKLLRNMGLEWTSIFESIISQGGYIVEFLPLRSHDERLAIVTVEKPQKNNLVNCRSLIKALLKNGKVSKYDYEKILKNLGKYGSERQIGPSPELGATIFLSSGVAALLAGAEALPLICHHYRVLISKECLDEGEQKISEFKRNAIHIGWVKTLLDRVKNGLSKGKYKTIKTTENSFERKQIGPGINLTDLLSFESKAKDVLWIDDRFCNGYAHKDNAPIIGINELLSVLRANHIISDYVYYAKLINLRKQNFRYVPITSEEIEFYIGTAKVKNGALLETEELKILRQYIASCLLDADKLQRPPLAQGAANQNGEIAFIMGVMKSCREAIANQWTNEKINIKTAEIRAGWILFNLYVGSFGLRHLISADDPENNRIDLIGLDMAALFLEGFSLEGAASKKVSEQNSMQAQYFKWVENSVANFRFKADPGAKISTTNALKSSLLDLIEKTKIDENALPYAKRFLQKYFLNLPAVLRNEMELDQAVMDWLGIKTRNTITIDGLNFQSYDFWSAVQSSSRAEEVKIREFNSGADFYIKFEKGKVQIFAINDIEEKVITFEDDVLYMFDEDPTERERVLTLHPEWFDTDSQRRKIIVGEILSSNDPQWQIEKIYELRQKSATCFYEKIRQRISEREYFAITELIPRFAEELLWHYRLCPSETDFSNNLDTASKMLLADEGLESALLRITCLPVKLPEIIRQEFRKLNTREQSVLLDKLRAKCLSPICKLHLIDLAISCWDDNEFVVKYCDELLNEFLNDSEKAIDCKFFESLLNWINNELSYFSELKNWSTSSKMALVWAHSSALYNIFTAGKIKAEILANELNSISSLNTELFSRDQDFWSDVMHPKRFDKARIIIDGLANIFAGANEKIIKKSNLSEKINVYSTQNENKILAFTDAFLMKNNLCSLIAGDRAEHLAILGFKEFLELSSNNLKRIVKETIEKLTSDPKQYDEWLKLIMIINDLPIYPELSESFEALLNGMEWKSILEDPRLASLVLRFCTNQIRNVNNDQIRFSLEKILYELSEFFSKRTEEEITKMGISPSATRDTIAYNLIENAFYLSLKPNSARETTRNFLRIVERIHVIWPITANVFSGIFRIAQELPAEQLHGIWQLILINRAVRN